ncbi:MAG: transglutaminase domain-containing protein [Phycisphaerae bacterium]|jgi:hypothetical protein|nr:transglutaminase domain-containing protein [Phycisphaerae bacterium]
MIDPARITVAKKQAELGTGVEDLFSYVRDQIRYDSYPGVLRGARGALLSQAANSLDQAILLHEFLKKSGHKSRFAHGTLDEAHAKALLRSMLDIETPPAKPKAKVDPKIKAMLDSLLADAKSQYQLIIKALTDGGFEIPKGPIFSNKNILDEIKDHYWVQYRNGNRWVDLDPSVPGAKIGQVFAKARETSDVLPKALDHRVVIRVVLEEEKPAGPRKRTLLTYEARARDMSGESLILSHRPGSWERPSPFGGVGNFFGALLKRKSYSDDARPVLVMTSGYEVGKKFAVLHPHNETGRKSSPGKGLFGGRDPFSPAPKKNKPVRQTALAEWIEFEFHSPDGKVEKAQRMIFDRVGFAARQKGGGKPAKTVLGNKHPLRALFCLSFYTGPLMNEAMFLKNKAPKTTKTVKSKAKLSATELGGMLKATNNGMCALSDALVFPSRSDGGLAVYSTTSPRLIISSIRPSTKSLVLSIDLRRVHYRPVTMSASLSKKAFRLQVLRGVVDGAVEALVVGPPPATATGKDRSPAPYSTVSVLRESTRKGIDTLLLKEKGGEKKLTASPEATSRISADIAKGYLLVLPKKPVSLAGTDRIAWWRIDRKTGQTVGVTDSGLHQAQFEYSVTTNKDGTYTVTLYRVPGQAVHTQTISADAMIDLMAVYRNLGYTLRFWGPAL